MFDYIHPMILPLGFFFFLNSSIGVIGNLMMILCFLKTKRLRSPCHILISLSCTADLLHLFSQFVFVVHLFGDTSSSQYQCFYMLLIPLCGIGASGPLILGMGIDRLIAVKFPTKYRFYQQEPKPYILSHLIFPIIYTICLLAYGFSTRIVDPKVQVQCAVPVSLNGSAFQFFTYSSAVIYFLVVVVYVSVYLLLKNSNASSRFKSVFKSISVTVGFVLFGWATTTLANTISYKITTDEFTMALIQMYAGVTVNMAAASNIFIFYAINSEYREIIKSIFGCKSKANSSLFEASSTNTIIVRTKSKAATTNKTGPSSLETGRRTTVV